MNHWILFVNGLMDLWAYVYGIDMFEIQKNHGLLLDNLYLIMYLCILHVIVPEQIYHRLVTTFCLVHLLWNKIVLNYCSVCQFAQRFRCLAYFR